MGILGGLTALNPAALIANVGTVGGQMWSTAYQNRSNVEQNRINRDWQEEMSNTAYQRAQADMEAAGLNPMLSLTHQAATPAGGAARMESPELGQAIATAFQLSKVMSEIDSVDASTNEAKARTAISEAALPGAVAESRLKVSNANAIERLLDLQTEELGLRVAEGRERKPYFWDFARDEKERSRWSADIAKEEWKRKFKENWLMEQTYDNEAEARNVEARGRIELTPAEVRKRQVEALLSELEIPGAKADAAAWETAYGREVRPYVRDAGGISSAAGSAAGILKFLLRRGR